jgi:membrane protein implicated in regulation of membrane protease activity
LNDKTLGYTIMAATILIMVAYFIWSFAPWLGTTFAWLTPYTEWAYKLPILGAAYLMLLIVLWIGYTMATTPPPIPLENPLDLESEDEKTEEKVEEEKNEQK